MSENPVLAVATTSLEDFSKAGAEPMTLPVKKLCLVGRKWVYAFNRWRAKKLIPARTRRKRHCCRAWTRRAKSKHSTARSLPKENINALRD